MVQDAKLLPWHRPRLRPRAIFQSKSPATPHPLTFDDRLDYVSTHITTVSTHIMGQAATGTHNTRGYTTLRGQKISNLLRTGAQNTKSNILTRSTETCIFQATAELAARRPWQPFSPEKHHAQHSLGGSALPRPSTELTVPSLDKSSSGHICVVTPRGPSTSRSPPRPKRSPKPPLSRCEPLRFEEDCLRSPEGPAAGAVEGRRASRAVSGRVVSSHRNPCGLPPHAGLPLPL